MDSYSGIIIEETRSSEQFTDFTPIPCKGFNILCKAKKIDKTLRLSLHTLEELHRGNKDFADYDIESSIAMTHGYDCDPMLQDLIEQSWNHPSFSVIMFHANETREEQEAHAAERKELCNNEQAGHGRLWNELWYQHHISLSWAFDHFFNHLSLFTIEDIMKIEPENFETKIGLTV